VNYHQDDTYTKIESYHALSIGILVLLEKLTAQERAIFLLKEIFSYDYSELAEIFEKTEDNCRQILKRAKDYMGKSVKRFEVDLKVHEKILNNFLDACTEGNMTELIGLLKEDIVLFADGGGRAIDVKGQRLTAALNPISGKENVSKFLIAVTAKITQSIEDFSREIVLVNGLPSYVSYSGVMPLSLISLEVEGDRIKNVYIQTNLDKLKQFKKGSF
jgi:RNA polymerase sigma-70 factor, ECF subfamily